MKAIQTGEELSRCGTQPMPLSLSKAQYTDTNGIFHAEIQQNRSNQQQLMSQASENEMVLDVSVRPSHPVARVRSGQQIALLKFAVMLSLWRNA